MKSCFVPSILLCGPQTHQGAPRGGAGCWPMSGCHIALSWTEAEEPTGVKGSTLSTAENNFPSLQVEVWLIWDFFLHLHPPTWNPQCLHIAMMCYNSRTVQAAKKINGGNFPQDTGSVRRGKLGQLLHLSLCLCPHGAGCCLLAVTMAGAQGSFWHQTTAMALHHAPKAQPPLCRADKQLWRLHYF